MAPESARARPGGARTAQRLESFGLDSDWMRTWRQGPVHDAKLPLFTVKRRCSDVGTSPGKLARTVNSPKRSAPERRGVHAWHAYYAGYSEAFVADILKELKIGADGIVLDPMNGSGTTTLVAQQHGHLSIGVELNPAMAIIARAKDPAFLNTSSLGQVAEVVASDAAHRHYADPVDEHTAAWIHPAAFVDLKRLEAALLEQTDIPVLSPDEALTKPLQDPEAVQGGRITDFLRAALLVTARTVSSAEGSKNPTWFKPGNSQAVDVAVFEQFTNVAKRMASELANTFTKRPEKRRLLVLEGDARRLPLKDNSVDAIVTSPPYLTRIDYAVSTAPELVLLGYESEKELRTLRQSIMGSTCVTGGSYDVSARWGKTCVDLVKRVRRHPSKASATYYFKMHVQYFRDAEAIVRECLRVLKPRASAVFVVQDSWYKDIHIKLDRIYVEMARELGATSAETIQSEAVRTHMGHVNTRAKQYGKGTPHEHIVRFRK